MKPPGHLDLDLLVVSIGSFLALAMAVAQVPVLVRLPLGLLAALVLPGYALSMAIFPPGELDAVERAALAFSLSLGVIVLGAPLLNLSPGALSVTGIVCALTSITLSGSAVAAWRRRGRSDVGQLPALSLPDLRLRQRVARRLALAGLGLATALVIALLALGVVAPARPATEFFMLGPGGTANSLPARIQSGIPVTITVGISNDDGSGLPYRIVVETGSTMLATTGSIDVGSDKTWTGNLEFTVPRPGDDQEIRILLFKGSDAEPYRSLRLEVDAIAPA